MKKIFIKIPVSKTDKVGRYKAKR